MTAIAKVASVCFLAVVAFYLVTEHLQHTLGALPYLLLLSCPLMHLFMHRGHRHTPPPPAEGDPHAPQ